MSSKLHQLATGLAAVSAGALLLPACSATSPDAKWPVAGPRAGLPYIPFPEKDDFGLDADTDADPDTAEPAATATAKSISGELPATPPTSLERAASCADKVCTLKDWLPDASFAKSVAKGAAAPGALWLESIKSGSTLMLPRNQHIDVSAVVLAGKLLATGDDGTPPHALGTWGAVRAPGAGISLRAQGADAKIVIAIATDQASLDETLAATKAKPWEARWRKRPRPIETADFDKLADLSWGGGAFHARIAWGGEGDKAQHSSLELLLTSADAPIGEHAHDASWEILGVLGGAGTMKVDGTDYPVKDGAVFQLPKGAKHAFVPAGDKPLLAVQLYTPSGPEQRFVKLAGASGAKPADAAAPAGKPAAKPAKPEAKRAAKPAKPAAKSAAKPAAKPAKAP